MALFSRAAGSRVGRTRRAAAVLDRARCVHTCDAVIIGSGLIGTSCALELRRAGFTTINVDANSSPGCGTTSSSSAIVPQLRAVEESCRLAWEGYHCWRAWQDHLEAPDRTDLCQLHETGLAVLDVPECPESRAYLSCAGAAAEHCRVPAERWAAAELQRQLPSMSMASHFPPRRAGDARFGVDTGALLGGALFCAGGGYISDPVLAAQNLADAAIRRGGAAFWWRKHVLKINLDPLGTRVCGVTMSDGSVVEAPIIVNAAGPHSSSVHSLAFESAEIPDDSSVSSRPLRVEVAFVPLPPASGLDRKMPVVTDMGTGIYLRRRRPGELLVGGLEPDCDRPDRPASAGDGPGMGPAEVRADLARRAALRFPELQVPNDGDKTGASTLHDATPDRMPIYDRTALGGFYSMRGTNGGQCADAPVAGRICAQLLEYCENGYDHDAKPLQIRLGHTSTSLSTGIFSRRREGTPTAGPVPG